MHINGELVSKVISSYYFLLSNFLFLHKFNFCYLTIIAISSKSSSKSKNVMDLKLDILERIHPYTDKFLFEIGVWETNVMTVIFYKYFDSLSYVIKKIIINDKAIEILLYFD